MMIDDATPRPDREDKEARLFRGLFGKPHRRPGQPHFPVSFAGQGCWWDEPLAIPLAAGRGFNVAVVGESQWQREIAGLVGGRCAEGHNCELPALLVPAGNALDPDAIGVMIDNRAVGWLPSDLAAELRPQIFALNPEGRPVTCKAKVVGGWDRGEGDRGYFGVRLSLALPLRIHPDKARRRAAAR